MDHISLEDRETIKKTKNEAIHPSQFSLGQKCAVATPFFHQFWKGCGMMCNRASFQFKYSSKGF